MHSIITHQYMHVKSMHIDVEYLLLEYFEKSVQCIILHSVHCYSINREINSLSLAKLGSRPLIFFAFKVIILHQSIL